MVIIMTKDATIHVRVNETVKANAEETLSVLGISISEAVNMFLCQVNLVGGMPFDVKIPAPRGVTVRNTDELQSKLDEAENDIACGKTLTKEEVFGGLRNKYGI